jgi:1-acyl-sn-glycerol-3-phosphate acyltransferase
LLAFFVFVQNSFDVFVQSALSRAFFSASINLDSDAWCLTAWRIGDSRMTMTTLTNLVSNVSTPTVGDLFLFLGLFVFLLWFFFWQVQGWLLSNRSGHFAPMISAAPRYIRWMVGCVVAAYFVGPVRIIGKENLKNLKGRVIITPKHVIETDAVLVAKLARFFKVRFLIAINQTTFPRGAPLAWMGAISVGYDKTNPALSSANAAKSAVKTMTHEKDSVLLVFPEGKLDKENYLERKNFRNGFNRIGRACQRICPEQNWGVLPVDVEYERDPAKATRFQQLVAKLGLSRSFLGNTVYGATVRYGKVIPFENLPADEDASTDVLFAALVGLRAMH